MSTKSDRILYSDYDILTAFYSNTWPLLEAKGLSFLLEPSLLPSTKAFQIGSLQEYRKLVPR